MFKEGPDVTRGGIMLNLWVYYSKYMLVDQGDKEKAKYIVWKAINLIKGDKWNKLSEESKILILKLFWILHKINGNSFSNQEISIYNRLLTGIPLADSQKYDEYKIKTTGYFSDDHDSSDNEMWSTLDTVTQNNMPVKKRSKKQDSK